MQWPCGLMAPSTRRQVAASRGVAIPNFQALAKARRPDAGSMQFLGFTTATHGRDDY